MALKERQAKILPCWTLIIGLIIIWQMLAASPTIFNLSLKDLQVQDVANELEWTKQFVITRYDLVLQHRERNEMIRLHVVFILHKKFMSKFWSNYFCVIRGYLLQRLGIFLCSLCGCLVADADSERLTAIQPVSVQN